jgi:hypothetical protein
VTVNAWARHYQSAWEERAGNPRFPLWLRVASLAYGSHGANGHAVFRPGEVAVALSTVDTTTGVITRPDRRAVGRAIETAVAYGWLASGSGTTCLVVPPRAISGGLGDVRTACPVHDRKRAKLSAVA